MLPEVKDKITPFPISHINLAMLTSEPHFKTNHTPYRAGCLENMAPFSKEGEDHSCFVQSSTWYLKGNSLGICPMQIQFTLKYQERQKFPHVKISL